MLYWISQQLAEIDTGFSVFGYITLRSILGALTALMISLLLGPWFIRRLVKQQLGQPIRKLAERLGCGLGKEGRRVGTAPGTADVRRDRSGVGGSPMTSLAA